MLARSAFPAFFFTLAGFILFLLVTLSVPIIKTIYLLQIRYPGGLTAANVGVLGTCYQGGEASFLGIQYSGISQCTDPDVGYTIDTTFFGVDLGSDTTRVIAQALSGSLVINAIAAGAAGVSLFFSFFAWFCGSRAMEIVTFLTLFLSPLAAWIAFALDLALALVAGSRINDYTEDAFSGHIGNAVWLALAGAIVLTVSICLAGCGMFGRYSHRRDTNSAAAPTTGGPSQKPHRRRFPWQRDPTVRGTY